MTSNMTYTQGHVGSNNLGYSAGCNNDSVTNNYFSNGTALKIVNCTGNNITGNTFYGAVVGFGSSGYPNNTFLTTKPTGVKTFVRPSAGSWVTYGLGSENQNLPGFITICPTLGHGGVRFRKFEQEAPGHRPEVLGRWLPGSRGGSTTT